MDLNAQIKQSQRQTKSLFIFKEGVRFKHMTGKAPILFRILPAYNPSTPGLPTGWIPFVNQEGQYASWGMLLHISRFVGHGSGKDGSMRRDLLSLKTFGLEAQCPIYKVIQTISAMSEDWGYLMADVVDAATKKPVQRKSISKPSPHFVTNVFDLNDVTNGVQIGVFNFSGTDALINEQKGLIFQTNNLPDEVVRNNYLHRYAAGDLTNPSEGPVLTCVKGTDKGEMSAYIVQLAKDGAGRQLKRPLDDGLLGQRYNMANPDSFINIPTDEDLVNSLIQLLNARSPKGYHEYALLRMALPEFRIPEPPSAPAASHVVSGGFGQNPSTIVHTPQPPPANAMAAFGVGATSGADEDDNINMNSTPAAGMAAAAASAQQGSGVSTPNPVVPGDSVGAQAESFVNRLLKSKRPGG